MNIPRWIEDKLMTLRTGVRTEVVNDGNPVDVITIRYKDVYLFVDIDVESGKPTGDFGWSHDPTMNPTVPIRDVWTAKPPRKEEL